MAVHSGDKVVKAFMENNPCLRTSGTGDEDRRGFSVIVNNLRYAEAKMETVASCYQYPNDWERFYEDLYRSKSGRWLLVGWGGSDTPYNSRSAYIELSPDDAKRYLECRHLSDELETLFGEEIEDA